MRNRWARALAMAVAMTAVATPLQASASALLDVPFVSQSERLCGGAAAAMVLRYWGERGVQAEDFASLVDDQAGGIRQSELGAALRGRGWTVLPLDPPGSEGLTRQLRLGRPVLALVEDAPGRYHYVVIVGSAGDRVVYHDPARAPFRTIHRDVFDRAWASTGRWGIVVVPSASQSSDPRPPASTLQPVASSPCAGLMARGVSLARDGNRTEAAEVLEAAVSFCPESADAHLELAGLQFLERRWEEAGALAARAVELAPESAHAWRVLASSRFIGGDADGALDAWNHVAEPRLDLVRVSGLTRTRHRVVEKMVDVEAGTAVTPASLARARRRVAELPALSGSRVGYAPVGGGLAEVDVAVIERPLGPSAFSLAIGGARAAIDRELVAHVSNVTGGGERFSAGWRFWENRPAVNLRAETPSLFGVTGLWTIEGSWSRQPYALGEAAILVEERRHAGVRFADWLTGGTRVEIGAGGDRWSGRSASAFVGGAVEQRLGSDRVALRVAGSLWPSTRGAFRAGTIGGAWRTDHARPVSVSARGGFEMASARAPLDLWPGAGGGHVRTPRLRAHPLLSDGVVSGGVFGRRLGHMSVEARRTLLTRGLMRFEAVAFGDAARAWQSLAGDRRLHIDAGGGLRLRGPAEAGAIAIDLARGLRDGRMALTIGWEHAWPGW
jgi:tetratricopeptide (TPR) repeat protein